MFANIYIYIFKLAIAVLDGRRKNLNVCLLFCRYAVKHVSVKTNSDQMHLNAAGKEGAAVFAHVARSAQMHLGAVVFNWKGPNIPIYSSASECKSGNSKFCTYHIDMGMAISHSEMKKEENITFFPCNVILSLCIIWLKVGYLSKSSFVYSKVQVPLKTHVVP